MLAAEKAAEMRTYIFPCIGLDDAQFVRVNSDNWPIFPVQVLIDFVTCATQNGNDEWNACRSIALGSWKLAQRMEVNTIDSS